MRTGGEKEKRFNLPLDQCPVWRRMRREHVVETHRRSCIADITAPDSGRCRHNGVVVPRPS